MGRTTTTGRAEIRKIGTCLMRSETRRISPLLSIKERREKTNIGKGEKESPRNNLQIHHLLSKEKENLQDVSEPPGTESFLGEKRIGRLRCQREGPRKSAKGNRALARKNEHLRGTGWLRRLVEGKKRKNGGPRI